MFLPRESCQEAGRIRESFRYEVMFRSSFQRGLGVAIRETSIGEILNIRQGFLYNGC